MKVRRGEVREQVRLVELLKGNVDLIRKNVEGTQIFHASSLLGLENGQLS